MIQLVAGCTRNVRFEAGKYLFREGDPADEFFLIRHGRVALEMTAPGRAAVTFQTVPRGRGGRPLLADSALSLGLRRPRARSRPRASASTRKCLRGKCESDHDFGYAMMKRFVPVLVERLQATRLQLLDVYGTAR